MLERDAIGADPSKDPDKDGEPARYGRFPNPTVHIGLNQIRRVVNRLIDAYGKPMDIVVELARDLKANREQKQNYIRRQSEGEKRNERYREDLQSVGLESTYDTRRKLRLWEEQGPAQARVCPYTGRSLSFEMVVSSQTEIDHILPFARTLDDSMANKVVCVTTANRDKVDRSPFKAFHRNPPGYDYQAILSRAAKLPGNKRWRFDENAMDRFENQERGFLDRQLNETRYLSRTARKYLACLYDEQTERKNRVRAIPGQMTALLRRGWGLEGMLRADHQTGEIVRKQRDDHRHHAVDAFVVANTTQGLLQRFADSMSSYEGYDAAKRLAKLTPPPWEGFHRNEVKDVLDRLIVSHKPDHGTRGQQGKTTGQLHNETAYGLVELVDGGLSKVVTRRQLSTGANGWPKTRKDLYYVRDDALRTALLELWYAEGGKLTAFVQSANEGVWLNGRLQHVQRVRVVQNLHVVPIRPREDPAGKPYKGYKSDTNEFAVVWEIPSKKKNWKIVAVPTFYANQRHFDLNRFRPHPVAKRIMRLHKNDMGALGTGAERRIVRVRKFGDGYVVLDDHNEADIDGRERRREIARNNGLSALRLREQGFRKVGVDEIGRVSDPGPRST